MPNQALSPEVLRILRCGVVSAAFILFANSIAFAQADFEDDGTHAQFNGTSVHVCSAGAMRGVDAGNGAILCAPLNVSNAILDAGSKMTFTYDGSSHSVHTCPNNTVMTGWRKANDWLICSTVVGGLNGSKFTDAGTQEAEPNHPERSLHACLPGTYMVGIAESDDVLICQSP